MNFNTLELYDTHTHTHADSDITFFNILLKRRRRQGNRDCRLPLESEDDQSGELLAQQFHK